jgi:hypothetical protein
MLFPSYPHSKGMRMPNATGPMRRKSSVRGMSRLEKDLINTYIMRQTVNSMTSKAKPYKVNENDEKVLMKSPRVCLTPRTRARKISQGCIILCDLCF